MKDCRKIIFSTNVAETSVTVEGTRTFSCVVYEREKIIVYSFSLAVEFVVDMGLVKQKFSNTKTGAGFLSV
jgi:hypothetical protein